MRKFILLTAALCLIAAPAMAVIKDSAHDLSSSSTYARQQGEAQSTTNFDRVCAFCHTPHAADLSVGKAPLWNRTTITAATWNFYNSDTIEYDETAINVTNSDIPLCMSCHDGASLNTALVNPVTGVTGDVTTLVDIGAGSTALLMDGANGLSNDHPVGFNYADSVGDAGIDTIANAEGEGAEIFGNFMWCASCHNVHEPGTAAAGTAPFLRTSNNGSALCLACHIK